MSVRQVDFSLCYGWALGARAAERRERSRLM